MRMTMKWNLGVVLLTMSAAGEAAAQGRWTYDSTKDEMTDAVRVHISANSIPTRSGRGYRIGGTLAWRCSADDGRDVLLLLGTYFGGNSDDQVLVEYRFDSEPASEGGWW